MNRFWKSLGLSLLLCQIHSNLYSSESCESFVSPVTFQKLATRIEECNVTTVEGLLSILPPDFRSRYVLVYNSRSLQGATPQYPRVILFGLDAKFILTFPGHPKLDGYDTLETMEFDSERKNFRLRSISFPAENPWNTRTPQNKPSFSKENPPQCLMCHRADPRPNWDTYHAWPGIFGSRGDFMPGPEKEQYQKFKNQVYGKIGRYRYLTDSGAYPDQAWYYDYYKSRRPNLQFTWLLSLLSSQVNARAIKEEKKLHPYRYALLSSLQCNDNFNNSAALAEIVPPHITGRFPKSYKEITDEVSRGMERSYAERERRQSSLLNSLESHEPILSWHTQFPREELDYLHNTARFRYVMEVAGIPFPKWSMEFGSANYVFFAGPMGQIGELGLFLWQELLDPVEDFEIYKIYLDAWRKRTEYGILNFSNGTETLCHALHEKSRETLNHTGVVTTKMPITPNLPSD